jgi:hypothetical protein
MSIGLKDFKDGDEIVRIPVSAGGIRMPIGSTNGYILFHAHRNEEGDSLQDWFDIVTNPAEVAIGRAPIYQRTNPVTRQIVRQNQLERFTYIKPASDGGRRIYFRVKKRKTKSRKAKTYKKTIKRRR